MTFIPHRSLQTGGDDLFDDNVHISRGGGTALFVSDVHRAVGLHRGGRPRDGQVEQRVVRNKMVSQNVNLRCGNSQNWNQRRRNADNNGVEQDPSSSMNWNQLYQLMLLNVMRNFQD